MIRQDSIHRQQDLETNRKIPFIGRELSLKSLFEGEDADVVVPCVTQDEEDEEAQPSSTPESSDQSLQDDTATDIWTGDVSIGEDSRSEVDPHNKEQLLENAMRNRPEHFDEENYGVETYLNHYETMLQRQEDENVATLAHLMPMLEVLEALVKGRTNPRIPNRDTIYYDRTTLLREFKIPELKRAYKQVSEGNTYFDFIQTDQQFMLVLKLLTQTSMACRTVSWAEIAHCYRICISGMLTLEEIPAGKMRNQIKERTISSLQGPAAPKVPSSILKQTSNPPVITSVTTSSSSPTISPLAHSETKSTFQSADKVDPVVMKMKETHESNVKEINLLKLTIAFLLGLMISVTSFSMSNSSTSLPIDVLLEQILEARALNAEATFSAPMTSSDFMTSIASEPQALQEQPQRFDILPEEMEEETLDEIAVYAEEVVVLESDKQETALGTFNAPTPIATLAFPPLSSLSAEVRTWGGIAVATAVAPAVLHAVVALASTSFMLPLGVAIIAATSTLEGVRKAVLHWLRGVGPLRKS